MSEIANTTGGGLAVLDQLAEEARLCVRNVKRNMFQLGRVLIEAKALVRHGEWDDWIRVNADGMSRRQAESLMSATARFDGRPEFEGIGQSALFKMLALPEGTEEDFIAEHDVKAMTVREVDEAVKRAREEARAEAQGQIDALKDECDVVRIRLAEMEKQRLDLEEARDELIEKGREEGRKESRAEADHFAEMAKRAASEKAAMKREKEQAEAELAEANEMVRDYAMQQEQTKAELLNLKSAQARGDAATAAGDELTIDVFSRAVREFMGLVARMPYMQTTFGGMSQGEKNQFAELLRTVEGWTRGARQALESVTVEGVSVGG